MLLGIDHLVVAVGDPDAAAGDLARALGLAWTGGGRHEAMGTFNRLAFLGDSYLELIGVFDRARLAANPTFAVGQAAAALLDHGRGGLATWAIATDDVANEVARLHTAGSPIGDPLPGSRARPDGEVVHWLTAFPALGPEGPPFLIEHELAGAEWGPAARAARAAFRHPGGGVLRLTGLELPVTDPVATMTRFATEVGLTFDRTATALVGGQAIRLRPHGGAPPVVELMGDPGTADLDVIRYGVRWRRRPGAAAER